MHPFGAEVTVGRGSKATGARMRRAAYLYPSSAVSPGHHVGIFQSQQAEHNTAQQEKRAQGPFFLKYYDDCSHVKAVLEGDKYVFPKIVTEEGYTPIHITDLRTVWIQCRHPACRKFRCIDGGDAEEARGEDGFQCSVLDDGSCDEPMHPGFPPKHPPTRSSRRRRGDHASQEKRTRPTNRIQEQSQDG